MTALSPSKRSLLAPTVPVLCERECVSGQPTGLPCQRTAGKREEPKRGQRYRNPGRYETASISLLIGGAAPLLTVPYS
jgi:hypothetical protein